MALLFSFALLVLAGCFYIRFRNVFQPGWTTRRNLPKPKQTFWLFRLLHEPTGTELEDWADSIEHNGLIRYFGLLNEERLLAASPEAVKELLAVNTYDYVKPEFQNEVITVFGRRGLVILEGSEHKTARRYMLPAFRGERIRTTYSVAAANATVLAQNLGEKITQGTANLPRCLHAATMECFGEWAMSTKLGALRLPQSQFGRLLTGLLKGNARGTAFIKIATILGLSRLLRLPLRAAKTAEHVTSSVRAHIEEIVTTRETSRLSGGHSGSADDFLDTLISCKGLSHEEIGDETNQFLVAATDMPANVIGWALHLLSRHPHVQDRLFAELDVALDDPACAGEDYLARLPFLNAVIDETFRLHHIDTVLWRTCIRPNSIAGTPIHPGVKVNWSPFQLGRSVRYWGKGAKEFIPERWLSVQREKLYNGVSSDFSFGVGARRCIGEQYARAVIRSMIAGLVQKFRFRPQAGDKASSDLGVEISHCLPVTMFKLTDGWSLDMKSRS